MFCNDCKEKVAINYERIHKFPLEMEIVKHSSFLLYENH